VSTLTEIAEGLADRIRTIDAFDQNVYTVVRRPAVYPAAILVPPAVPDYGLALDGQGAEFEIGVLVLVGTTEAEGQGSLFPFLDWVGPSSIPAAVEADRTLGGLDVDARVRSAEAPGLVELPDGTVAFGSTVRVGIFAT
jgi:hypothetical protein